MGLFGFLGKKETDESTAAANDTEKWIIGTYAMWSQATDGNWKHIAGSTSKNKKEAASMRVMLRRDWEVSNKAALFDMVNYLTALYKDEGCEQQDIEKAAWDLCRACQILGMGYVGGYIERQEMVRESVEIGRIMQKHFHSWEELYDSYMKGYSEWRKDAGEDAEKDIQSRKDLCQKLRNMPDGPCTVEWNMAL